MKCFERAFAAGAALLHGAHGRAEAGCLRGGQQPRDGGTLGWREFDRFELCLR